MKKWLNTIFAGVASLFTFIFMALPAWTMKTKATGGFSLEKKFNGYQLISGKIEGEKIFEEIGAWKLYRVFAIILIVLAVVLALYAVFTLLVNLEVVKLDAKVVDLIGNVVLSLTVVVSIVALVACMRINDGAAKEMGTTVKEIKEYYSKFGTQVGLWLVTVFNVLACACAWTFSFVGKKSK